MRQQASRGGNHHIGSHLEAALLLGEGLAVGAAVHGHAAHGQIVAEALHLVVDLLRQLARRRHHYAVNGIGGSPLGVKSADDGQQIGGGFARAGLGAGYEVAAFEYVGYGLLLYGCAFVEVHVVECVEHFVAEV